MEFQAVSSIAALSSQQLGVLKQGGIVNVADLLLASPFDVARKARVSVKDVEEILDTVCHALAKQPRALEDVQREGDEKFTTGDERLDEALGGGVRMGMLWEVVGESAAGKTQLALQLSLMVQLPPRLGGIAGSTCYVTVTTLLPTSRLIDIRDNHPLLSPSLCDLSDVHTIKAPGIPILLHVLSRRLPDLLDQLLSQRDRKPVKLLVIDALTELFHSHDRVSKDTLFQRSKDLTKISALLHGIASKYQIAVLVLNEVVDVFEQSADADMGRPDEVLYREQSRLFSRADYVPGGSRKEASLGLVWANQINVRVMLSRTERMRVLDEDDSRAAKRPRLERPQATVAQPIRVRRLNVIFSSVGPPAALDYVVRKEGITTLPED
ncbi:P-loop containing nucleoside triphosphate hydrolase protein, partial [Fomitopsis serialis]|uniref:P-loop containing nucleoside triphosphate hydrolase protein n=1 Tax=Fomitopsis serialis TaxID=139415 RepID=UPI002008C134